MKEIVIKGGLFALSLASVSSLALLSVVAVWFSAAWLLALVLVIREAVAGLLACH